MKVELKALFEPKPTLWSSVRLFMAKSAYRWQWTMCFHDR